MKIVVRRKIPVTAISDKDIAGLLRRLGLYKDVVEGRAKCYICGRRLTLENIGAVLIIDGKPVLVCDKPSCIAEATLLQRRRSKPVTEKPAT